MYDPFQTNGDASSGGKTERELCFGSCSDVNLCSIFQGNAFGSLTGRQYLVKWEIVSTFADNACMAGSLGENSPTRSCLVLYRSRSNHDVIDRSPELCTML